MLGLDVDGERLYGSEPIEIVDQWLVPKMNDNCIDKFYPK